MKLSAYGLTIKNLGIEINFTPEAEYLDFTKGHFEFEEDVKHIQSELENGNEAAWFSAKVSLNYKGLESEAEYLGGCSYNSFDEFTGEENGYFDDMLRTCFEDLKSKIEDIKNSKITL